MSELDELIDDLWSDYLALNPQAQRVWELLTRDGAKPRNDHVALRGFAGEVIGIDSLARAFEAVGYRRVQDYQIADKRLDAWHFQHESERAAPKVFISELRVGELSEAAQRRIADLVQQLPADLREDPRRLVCAGRPWELSIADYEALREESEYAAWVAAFGLRANHFTVDLDSLTDFEDLYELNAFLSDNGIPLNDAGGQVKGSAEQLLEQSATRAAEVPVQFSDGELVIPACYVEFARRYPGPDGDRFEGFIAQSANRIFESTDRDREND